METPLQYKARILALMQGKDPIAIQSDTYRQIATLIQGVPLEKLSARRAAGKWSVAEILAHLAEAEVVSTWRYRQMLEHNGCPLPGYAQDLWASLGQYPSRDPRESFESFRLLREANLRMFERLTPEQWRCHGVHAERGYMTVHDLAIQIAGHDLNHVAQIKAALRD